MTATNTLRVPEGVNIRDAATRASNARKEELKRLADPCFALGVSLLNNNRKLLKYMEYNFGALNERELVEALSNHLEVLAPNVLQSDANLFIGYARIALHTGTPHEAMVYLLQEIAKITGRAAAVERVWNALSEQFATVN